MDDLPARSLADPDLAGRVAAPRLRASWHRSQDYGVPPDEVIPVFTGSPDTGSLLYECAHRVLTDLQSTIANEPVSLMVADSDGLVLARLGDDRDIRRSLDRVHLAPGFTYSERNAGTNGLGLSLADRAPSLVRAGDHYCTDLRGYTCAAAPVLEPLTGQLAGSINLTTWSESSSELLLGLAQTAASATSALMLVRAGGRTVRPAPRGEVFSVVRGSAGDDDGDLCVSAGWRAALDEAARAVAAGRVLTVLGEPGAGKATLAALARRRLAVRQRLLHARAPEGGDVAAWLELWTPELHDPDTCVIVSGLPHLPAWAAGDLARTLAAARRPGRPQPFVLSAPEFAVLPDQLARLADAVVEVPPLRARTEDVLPLAGLFARQERHRTVALTPRAARALTGCPWPGNVRQLRRVVREAAARADVVDVHHLAPEVLDGGSRPLSRLERLERDEIVRCLTEPGTTMTRVAEELGIGRATLYRKIAQYKIAVPRSG
ncbi:regulatory protein, Fis family [Geodermatophilus dictyosporus]|uniref:Regulatory protein, Fis family n=1 Tax=Geodermatophilus dictyosporus TaxID=1523247 RepID=A0A1I5JT42_9ACTN|nr:helix-turn-helix domain-containing protein [Geodermatophilus dictyosporus]SFO75683.1 regulatory protein, Fis family [Geodermatophilus dictyosporus]